MRGPALSFHNLHLPDEVRVFAVPVGAVRRWDDETLVYDVRVPSGGVLRHYSFYRRWFEVNCSLGADGRFVTEPGPIDWSFNGDVCSPCFSRGAAVYNVDLLLDVLVAPDGREHAVKDREEFERAVACGWLSAGEATGARRARLSLCMPAMVPPPVHLQQRSGPFWQTAQEYIFTSTNSRKRSVTIRLRKPTSLY